MQNKTGVLLVNLGTPDSSRTRDVRKYLKEFLLDARVIDINAAARNFLVRFIIAPFRAPRSAKLYKEIWTDAGSPLLVYTTALRNKLQNVLGDAYIVVHAMRYQNPSIKNGLEYLKSHCVKKIIVLPLFPQYASASTGSVAEQVMQIIKKWNVIPEIIFKSSFHNYPLFIEALAQNGKKYDAKNYDYVLFSFHGLPERQIIKTSPQNNCLSSGCCDSIHEKNRFCYRAQCFDTARLLAQKLHIDEQNYTVCFQSRLGKTPWIKPYSDEVINTLARKGKKKLLAFSPAFVADCLETLYEIGIEYDLKFKDAGGEKIQLVESLNDSDIWIECVKNMLFENNS